MRAAMATTTAATALPRWRAIRHLPAVPIPNQPSRTLLIETVVVMLATFGTSIGVAVLDLAGRLVGYPLGGNPFLVFIPGHATLSVVLASGYLLLQGVAIVALVIYVLYRSGESLGSLGLSWWRKRRDLLLLVPFAVLALGLQWLGQRFPLAGQVTSASGSVHVPAVYAVTGVVRSVQAGIIEEIVVLGFVLTRLRQLGVHPVFAIVISAVLRASYHVEYGWAVLGPLFFGIGVGVMYLSTRRLLPAIVVHASYDVWTFFQAFVFVA